MKIYVASSWRNERQPLVVSRLRQAEHDVYDFRNPGPENYSFNWSQIDPGWQEWTLKGYQDALDLPVACFGFDSDMQALSWCDVVIGVQPFGRSASLELGWGCGAGKHTVLLLAHGEPELMLKMCDYLCITIDQVIKYLEDLK